jgi:hypothetical protein
MDEVAKAWFNILYDCICMIFSLVWFESISTNEYMPVREVVDAV